MRGCAHPGCRAYPMRGERWCRAHHPDLPRSGGAPVGNRNAYRHGLYSRFFTEDERRALAEVAGVEGLDMEIAALRVAIARLLGDGTAGDAASRLAVLARGVDALGRALRHQRVIAGDRAGSVLDALDQILEELGLGVES